jgi:Virulence-associated protein E
MASTNQRFRRAHPCPICGGHEAMPRGTGQRCHGWLSSDGEYAHCARVEYAGSLKPDPNGDTYAHRLVGDCKCGVRHDPTPPYSQNGNHSTNGNHRPNGNHRRLVATYEYHDERGAVLFQVLRYVPKDFKQRRPDGKGGWIWGLKGVSRVVYRLPNILQSIQDGHTICLAEGEEDVKALVAHHYAATCNSEGAGKWTDLYSQQIKDAKDVVLFGDNDDAGRAHIQKQIASLKAVGITPKIVKMEGLPEHGDVRDWLKTHTADDLAELIANAEPAIDDQPKIDQGSGHDWRLQLSVTKEGVPHETLLNVKLALEHLEPWAMGCWYDEVRDLRMVGERELDDVMVTAAGLALETQTKMRIRSKHLIPRALDYLCHQHPRDLLREWLENLPPWDKTTRLSTWLITYAHAPNDAYSQDVSRLLIVSPVARAMDPGCQYRYVVILEGPENAGKTKLVRALVTPEWYRELSHGLDGKEAHMRIKRAWVAELAELASLNKTEEARLKSFFTMNEDAYIPKFSNFEVVHKRRTVFVGTVNPEGDNTYLRGQTGNTRYLPIAVRDMNIEGFEAQRDQLFAEALQYYRDHPNDWWQLSSDGESAAEQAREDRRQRSVYEDDIGSWLERSGKTVIWWEEIARDFLSLPRERWADRRAQMEIAKALKALGWDKDKRERIPGVGLVVPWRPGSDWHPNP